MIDITLQKFMPSTCPVCGKFLKYDNIHLYCDNDECEGKVYKKLASACGMLDLKGIAGQTIKPFAQDFLNMYELFRWVIIHGHKLDIEGYGIKNGSRSHEIFVNAFLNIKSLTYAQVILMMGYDRVGNKLAEQVARDYCGLEPDYKGHEKALVEMFKDKEIKSYIQNAVNHLESLGVNVDKPKVKVNNDTVYICMTGSPSPISKTKEEFISYFSNVKEVSLTDKNCQYLITNSLDSLSNKMKTAEKKGIKIITYIDFKNKFNSL